MATNGETGQKAAGAELPQEDNGAMESETCIQPVCDTSIGPPAKKPNIQHAASHLASMWHIGPERKRQVDGSDNDNFRSCLYCGCYKPFHVRMLLRGAWWKVCLRCSRRPRTGRPQKHKQKQKQHQKQKKKQEQKQKVQAQQKQKVERCERAFERLASGSGEEDSADEM